MSTQKLFFLFVLDVLLLAVPSYSEELINGDIDSDTVWTSSAPADDGVCLILGRLAIKPGVTLRIEEDVVVKVGKNAEKADSLHCGVIQVQGALIVQGSPHKPVIFTSVNDHSVGGKSLLAMEGSPSSSTLERLHIGEKGSSFSHCEFRYLKHGIFVETGDPGLSFDNCRFVNCRRCLSAGGNSAPIIRNSSFLNPSDGAIVCNGLASPIIENNLFIGCARMVCSGRDTNKEDAPHPKIRNNTFVDSAGHCIELYRGTATIENNIFAFMKGMALAGSVKNLIAAPLISRNCFYSPGKSYQYLSYWPATNSILLDPQFVGHAKGDYSLSEDSPCRRAGKDGCDLGWGKGR